MALRGMSRGASCLSLSLRNLQLDSCRDLESGSVGNCSVFAGKTCVLRIHCPAGITERAGL
jgi:hypothetical protein